MARLHVNHLIITSWTSDIICHAYRYPS